MGAARWGLRSGDIRGWDALIAVVIAVVQLGGGTAANAHQDVLRDLDPLGYALLAAGPLLLLVRRRYPEPVLYGTIAAAAAYLLLGYGYGPIFLSLVVAFLTAGVRGSRWRTYPLVLAGYLAMVWPVPGWRGYASNSWQQFGLLAWLVVLVAIAEGIRQRRAALLARREQEAEALRNAEAERARELAEQEQRAGEERLAIARELHDVLAHSLSLINVQSSVALELFDRKPEQAATALAAIKTASKDALGEVNSLLRSIRGGTATVSAPVTPTVGIGDLEALTGPARTAGVQVRTIVTGTVRRLPAVVEVAAARIVQEALTNVVRHAPGASVLVTIRYSAERLFVCVENTPPARAATETSGGGHGIRGMTERANALGGRLAAAPKPDGGFRVEARLPAHLTQPEPAT
ncbi:sensor histidine kinase [Nocardia sp. NPDC055321]